MKKPEKNRPRMVITGLGVVSPIGIGRERYWNNLLEGRSSFKEITLFDTSGLKVKIAGEIEEFNPSEILGEKRLMDFDRTTLLLLSAAKLAIEDSGIKITQDNTHDIGVSVGTTFGSLSSLSRFDRESLTEGPRYVNPSIFPSTVSNSPASRVNIKYGIKGFSSTISTGMCAALDALDYARDFISLGRANTVIAGSAEDLSMQIFLGFYSLNYLSGMGSSNKPVCCPFDKRRDGIVLSEGAAVLILEDLDTALSRNVNIYAEVLGTGSCFDPARFYSYNPKGSGMANSMRMALEDAQLGPADIDCIFANANSTKDADSVETRAIKEAFAHAAYDIPVTAVKSSVGEGYSVSGGFAAIAACLSLKEGLIPRTMNYEKKDEECDLNYVTDRCVKKDISRVMVNSFGPNGANTALVMGRYKNDDACS